MQRLEFLTVIWYSGAMKSYELTYIISSGIKTEEAENLKKEVELSVQNKGGVIVKSEKTAPQVFSYTIKKNSSGYFATLEFQVEESHLKTLREELAKNPHILRHIIIIKKLVKQIKERRMRRPLTMVGVDMQGSGKEKSKAEKVDLGDIEKKLDEILGE